MFVVVVVFACDASLSMNRKSSFTSWVMAGFLAKVGCGQLIKIDTLAAQHCEEFCHEHGLIGVLAACDMLVMAMNLVAEPIRRPTVSRKGHERHRGNR